VFVAPRNCARAAPVRGASCRSVRTGCTEGGLHPAEPWMSFVRISRCCALGGRKQPGNPLCPDQLRLGALRKIGDVPIVDRYVLGLYLSEGGTRMQSYTDDPDSGIRLDFYSNAAEAATGFAQFLASPNHLEAYRKSAERSVSQQPNFVQRDRSVISAYPTIHLPAPTKDKA